jgi:rod shape determining protein RodA
MIKSICLLFITLILLSIGWFILSSAAPAKQWANPQLYSGLILLLFGGVIFFLEPKVLYKYSYPFFFFCLFILFLAEILGHKAMGAQRWLKIGPITLQPSELMKLGVIIILARIFSDMKTQEIGQVRNLIKPTLLLIIPTILILKQPNLGTSLILLLVGGAVFFVAGVRAWKFGLLLILFLLSLPLIWTNLHAYQKQRVLTFLNPDLDLLGAGYNIMQSKIAIGSGGLLGKGYLQGSQVQLSFLPEKHTDFIFTILAEEFGFLGVIMTIGLYFFLLLMIYLIALQKQSKFSQLICLGVASLIFFHLFINLAMISGIIPVVGTPLPLLSYGRSNLATSLLGILLVIWADFHKNKQVKY